MSLHDDFVDAATKAGKEFVEVAKGKHVALVTHFDTDGLSSAALLELAFDRENISYVTMHAQSLDEIFLDSVFKTDSDVYVFADIGATVLEKISEFANDKLVFVLDHHEPSTNDNLHLVHINPLVSGVTEKNSISGSGVCYFFAMGMNKDNRTLAHLAVIGAIGDSQEDNGFQDLNNRILQHAVIQKTVVLSKQIKLYGINSRPLLKVLEYSSDVDIPGVTNDPKGVKDFLDDLGIMWEWNGRLKKWFNLRPFEQAAITEKILELKGAQEDDSKLLVYAYSLPNAPRREMIDIRECATIINASGRLEQYRVGVNTLKGDRDAAQIASMNLRVYKSAIRDALQIVDDKRAQGTLIENDKLVLIDFENKIPSSIVGIVASILARNKIYREGVVVCTLGETSTDEIKVSLRVSLSAKDFKLQEVLSDAVSKVGGTSGGHDNAAGAVINKDKKEEFIESIKASF
ncbi:DHH family phosphoesterase [Candidatus Woesearchaeota archaeon]|nr:DHH family phosphoesterase [Candidatus Woesearchaeota archaeon]